MTHIKRFDQSNDSYRFNESSKSSKFHFVEIKPTSKVDPDFEATATKIANLIRKDSKFETLKELAMDYQHIDNSLPGEHPKNDMYIRELDKAFPEVLDNPYQYIKGGMKIPFYGRTDGDFIDTLTGHESVPKFMNIYNYISLKVKDPGYKFG